MHVVCITYQRTRKKYIFKCSLTTSVIQTI